MKYIIIYFLSLLSITIPMFAQEKNKDVSSKLVNTTVYKSMKEFDYGKFIEGLDQRGTFSKLKSESDSLSTLVFGSIAPLHPSRLERRMKILYGIDISNYNKDDIVYLGNMVEYGYTLFDTNSGLIWIRTLQNSIYEDMIPTSFPIEKYILFYRYLMYNDDEILDEYHNLFKNTFGNDWDITTDFVYSIYEYSFFLNYNSVIKYVDKNTFGGSLLRWGEGYFSNQKLDAIYLYLLQADNNNRKIKFEKNTPEEIFLERDFIENDKLRSPLMIGYIYENKISYYQSIAAWLSFHIKLNNSEINKKIIKFLYGKEEQPYSHKRNQTILDILKQKLIENNYFGYTVLREFLENPLRETPSIAKLGIAYKRASVKANNPLLLEPLEDSYNIDTVMPHEQFIAYEMGHDKYYYIEIEKPVESPVAGPDGYAAFMGRTEIVRGYLPKNKVVRISGETLLAMNKYNNLSKSKKGAINDPDGYVNIRSEENFQSPVLGKIMEGDIFNYWETDSGWYIVQTKNGLRGFVYKTRIKEHIKDERWTP